MGKHAIDNALTTPGLKLMNHVVAGYPNPQTARECIRIMEEAGSDMVEIQIPFSDPMADGPTIVKANHSALIQGMTLKKFWDWLAMVRRETHIPLLLMTYYNIPYRMGLETFFSRAQDNGISGIIIPDIPFDNRQEHYLSRISSYDLHPIQVISPSVRETRLEAISGLGSGFIYTTLKVGITGSSKPQEEGVDFLNTVRRYFSIPIAAGFGITSPEQTVALRGKADIAVIGSQGIRLVDEAMSHPHPSFQTLFNFIQDCKGTS